MLDQLVESKGNSKENSKKNSLLVGVFLFMVVFMLGGWLYSLFAQDYAMGAGDLELSDLVAPVIPDQDPPPPPEKQPETKAKVEPNVDIRKELIQNIDMSPKIPDKVETAKQTQPPMSLTKKTVQGNVNFSSQNSVDANDRGPINADEKGIGSGSKGSGDGPAQAAPPPPPAPPVAKKEEPKPSPPPVPKVVSGGVVNGKATSLPKPPYPPAARAVHASGTVSVQVLIDESGRVISASAVSGHPLLRQAAVSAAQQARFSPTVLSGQPVKVNGIITYNFVP